MTEIDWKNPIDSTPPSSKGVEKARLPAESGCFALLLFLCLNKQFHILSLS